MSLQVLELSGVTAVDLANQAPDPVTAGSVNGDVAPGPGLPFAVNYSLVAYNPTASSITCQQSDDNVNWTTLGVVPAYSFLAVSPSSRYVRAGAVTADTIYLLGS